MAIGPLVPDNRPEDFRVERRLTDRAQFLGDAGRTGKSQETRNTDEEDPFQAFLDKKLKAKEAEESEETEAGQLGQNPGDPGAPMKAGPREETGVSAEDLHRTSQKQGREEAEKAGGGAPWRGPSPLLGLAMISGLAPLQTGTVQAGQKSRSDDATEKLRQSDSAEARVDPALLQGLRQAGLEEPLVGLDDPRLTRAPNLDPELGWRTQSQSGSLVCRWETPGRTAYQTLEWSDSRQTLETASGSDILFLERQGNQVTARRSKRAEPRPARFRIES